MAQVSETGIRLIQRFESCRLVAYDDGTGVWTIGWGHTGQVDGTAVGPGMAITQEKVDLLFAQDLKRFERAVGGLLTRPATQGQFDALVSFGYNAGVGEKGLAGSTLLKRFNAGKILEAAEQFIEWILPPSAMRGLVRRRAAEIVRFLT